jgi:hypothetical protein
VIEIATIEPLRVFRSYSVRDLSDWDAESGKAADEATDNGERLFSEELKDPRCDEEKEIILKNNVF